MKHFLFFDDNINAETMQALSGQITGILANEEDSIELWLSSFGGHSGASEFLLRILKTHKARIHVHFFWAVYSCILDLFLRCPCSCSINPDTHGIAHLISLNYSYRELKDPDGMIGLQLPMVKKSNKDFYKLLKKRGCPKRYLKKFWAGRETNIPTSVLRLMKPEAKVW